MTVATVSPSSAQVKFHLAGGAQPLILLPVQVNGQGPFEFILDTGAGTSLITPSLAKQLDIRTVSSKEGHTAGGRVAVSLARADSLGVGALQVEQVDLGIVELGHISQAVGAHIDGDLGYNFLKHFCVTIDYGTGEIRLHDPRRSEEPPVAARAELPMRLAHPAKPLILVDVYANDRGPFQFAIDTGTSTTAIGRELADTLGLETAPVGPVTTGSTAAAVTAGSLRSFRLGSAKMDDVTVIVADFFETLSNAVGARLAGIVGHNFLRHYKIVIDYPNERLKLL